MNANEIRDSVVVKNLLKAAREDAAIGRCSVCHREVRWSEAMRPFTAPPVHVDCHAGAWPRDDRTRTPPHGDALHPALGTAMCLDCYRIASPVAAGWVCNKCGGASRYFVTIDAALEARAIARAAPVDPATRRAMAGPEIPHNEAGVPIMPDDYCDSLRPRPRAMRTGHIDPTVRPAAERRLPSHIERAASQAYAAGHDDGASCGCGSFIEWDEDRGVDAFRESLRRDGERIT